MAHPAQAQAIGSRRLGDRGRALGLALGLGLGLRIVLGFAAWLGLKLYPSLPQVPAALQNQGLEPPLHSWQDAVAGPWQRWDSLQYDQISVHGYNDQNVVFPPLFPMLQRALAPLFGGSAPVAGVAISTASLVIGLYLLHRLITTELNSEAADRTVIYLTVFPTAFFFAANYAEALFLALSVGCFLCARRRQFVVAGVLGGAATLCRNQGILLAVPIAMEAWSARRERQAAGRSGFDPLAIAAVLLPCAALAGWWAYVIVGVGVPGGPAATESNIWHDHAVLPPVVLYHDLQRILHPSVGSGLQLADLAVLVMALAAIPLMWRRLPRSYTVYAVLSLLVMISREVDGKLVAVSRFVLVVFPFFALAGLAGRRAWLDRTVTLVSPALLALATFHFTHWGYFG